MLAGICSVLCSGIISCASRAWLDGLSVSGLVLHSVAHDAHPEGRAKCQKFCLFNVLASWFVLCVVDHMTRCCSTHASVLWHT
jgi:hypothetical protein